MGYERRVSRITPRMTLPPPSLEYLTYVVFICLTIFPVRLKVLREKGSNLACSILYSHIKECIEHSDNRS